MPAAGGSGNDHLHVPTSERPRDVKMVRVLEEDGMPTYMGAVAVEGTSDFREDLAESEILPPLLMRFINEFQE